MYNIVRQGQIIEEETKQLGLEPLEVDTQLLDASNDFHPAGDLQHIKKEKYIPWSPQRAISASK